jgi:hypothetical protein
LRAPFAVLGALLVKPGSGSTLRPAKKDPPTKSKAG